MEYLHFGTACCSLFLIFHVSPRPDFYFIAKTSKYLLNFDIELKIKRGKNKNAEKRGN